MSIFGSDPSIASVLLPSDLPRQTAGSYSSVKQHHDCPRVIKFRKIDRLPEPKSEHLVRGLSVHDEIAAFISGSTDKMLPACLDPTWLQVMERLRRDRHRVELQVAFDAAWNQVEYFSPEVRWRAVFDTYGCAHHSDAVEIHEWKTGKEYPEDHEQQCRFYALMAMKMSRVPLLNVVVRLGYLDRPCPTRLKTYEYPQGMRDELQREFDLFVRDFFIDTIYPARPSYKCAWCHFRRANGGPCEHGPAPK
jgi:CRISPR/Cas system-associated exonuclease Cas4 (RecB family)